MATEVERAFLELVRENDTRLRRICRVYAHSPDARQDLYQEILLQLWRSLPSFVGASSAATWLYRVALNTALARTRRGPERREVPLDDVHSPTEEALSADIAERLDAAERSEQLEAAIARLNPIDKMLVTLYLDDRTYHEMADVLGISESNVGVKLHRIRKLLATWLTEATV